MRSFLSYKTNRKIKVMAAAGIAAAYFLGFSAKVYSPAHIGRYAIPVPTLIPIIHTLSSGSADKSGPTAAYQQSGGPSQPLSFAHTDIITTYFWVGEAADSDNGYIANAASAWDEQWQAHYGGADAPSPRSGYLPGGFTPKENPFYFALPYNDLDAKGNRKSSAANCPLAAQKSNYSWCKNSWIAIRHNGKIAYAQWEDVGPFGEDDTGYVFGNSQPKNKQDAKAGLDVSPAVKDYLGLQDVDKTDWIFVASQNVPEGPWKQIITTTTGESVN
jgi:hypothetical protein